MGNTLRSPINIKKLRNSKKRKPAEGLAGMEIMVDPNQVDLVSEVFDMPDVDMPEDCSHSDHAELSAGLRSSANSNGKRLRTSSRSSQRSSQRSSVADDLMACIIPGMDPSELLQLVEECAEEERRERELEESQRSCVPVGQKPSKSSKNARKRVKCALTSNVSY